MAGTEAQPEFPLIKTVTQVTLVSALVVGVAAFGGQQMALLDQAGVSAVISSGACGWLVCVASFVLIGRMSKDQPNRIAMTQLLGSIGRLLVGVLLMGILVSGFRFSAKPVIAGFMAVYIPVMIIEAAVVANYVKALTAFAGDRAVTMTEQVS